MFRPEMKWGGGAGSKRGVKEEGREGGEKLGRKRRGGGKQRGSWGGGGGNDIEEQWKRMEHTIQMCKMEFTSALKQEP